MIKVLLVDHSGRGHAYADLFSRTSPEVTVYYAPGCAAVRTERVISCPALSLADPLPMIEFARREGIDFVLVANTLALARGFVDAFRANGLPVVGPDKQASRLETSKFYTKQLCLKYGIPSPEFASFTDPQEAADFVRNVPYHVVVKADGLCGGNGAFVCDSSDEALRAIERLMIHREFGEAGERIVIERRLEGREFSFFAFTDGLHYKTLPLALDYPKSDDGNRGVTSGGMGALSPHPLETAQLTDMIQTQLLEPVLECIQGEGLRYSGVIYLGCMLADAKLYLLEINARMGDPEAEVVFPRIESNFLSLCTDMLNCSLDAVPLELNDLSFCDVVATQGPTPKMADGQEAGSYPGWPFGPFGRYYPVRGLDRVNPAECKLFLGEASVQAGKGLVTDGGRVLHVVGFGPTQSRAVQNAYANVKHIEFEGIRYRSDIGRVLPWE